MSGLDLDPKDGTLPRNMPVVTLTAFVVLAAISAILVISGAAESDAGSRLVNSILAALPVLLVAGGYAERNNRDLRNGVATEAARKGAHKAIEEKQVVTRDGPMAHASAVHTQALIRLLEQNTAATVENTAAQERTSDDHKAE